MIRHSHPQLQTTLQRCQVAKINRITGLPNIKRKRERKKKGRDREKKARDIGKELDTCKVMVAQLVKNKY
jgi:hypothetical protein